ncbi:MAG: NAD-dependent epimerase/dehydratase family protein [Deltaproteobacteria bacterium]|nr:NAD-dependent epimerase/dehydratase family protein [Deltaproteobacteria bacterium]
MSTALVTGSSGLVGSEAAAYFADLGFEIHGVDNNMRMDFFGEGGDTRARRDELLAGLRAYTHHDIDIRDRGAVDRLVATLRPTLVAHCAAQPSHDLAASRPFDDFDVNAAGTLNMLEAVRRHAPDAVFCHLSTNKVYGDAPNELALVELETRFDYADEKFRNGIAEDFRIDASTHSLFGASKLAGDVMVQEYGRYFGMKTVCFRGGCLTGPNHAGVELHGFLQYLIKVAARGGTYKIFGYKGKQVRDNLHSLDVCRAMHAFFKNPRPGEVCNLGGGRGNSISILEAKAKVESLTGRELAVEYVEQNRVGDHICYISDLSKLRAHYPDWDVSVPLDRIFEEIYEGVSGAKK